MNTDFTDRVEKAATSVREHTHCTPAVGVILGSGLGAFAEHVTGTEIEYKQISGFPIPTVAGHRGLLSVASSVAVMSGRFHHYEGYTSDDVVLPVAVLHAIGVRRLILTNAAGGIREDLEPGELVLLCDHLNLMGMNPLRGPNIDELGPRFPDMSGVYSAELRRVARSVADGEMREGVYAALSGPNYETPAEVRMLRGLGADMVGMSTVPEAIYASYLGMEILGISCITNMAAGILDAPLDHADVVAIGRQVAPRFCALLSGVIDAISSE